MIKENNSVIVTTSMYQMKRNISYSY